MNNPLSKLVKDFFTFIIFPMINPDGATIGNTVCNLSGHNLHNRWVKPSKKLDPEIYSIV